MEAGSSATVFGMAARSAGSMPQSTGSTQADDRQRELELAGAPRAHASTAHPLTGAQAGAASAMCCSYTVHFACRIFHLACCMRLHAARYAKDNTGHGTAQRASATPAQRMVLRVAMRGALIGCSCGAGRPRPPAATDYFLADDARHARCAVASAEYFQYPRDGACVPACACVGACAHAWARARANSCAV